MKNQTLTKGQRTRLMILEGAIDVITKRGIEDTSFQMIADHVGLSQQGVMNHFKNKESLFMGVLGVIKDRLYTEIQASFTPYDDAFQLIKKHFNAQLVTIQKYPVTIQLYLWLYYKASHSKRFQELYTATLLDVHEQYLKYILAGQREGIFHFKEEAILVAEKLHDTFMGSIINFSVTSKTQDKEINLLKKWDKVISLIVSYRDL